MVCGALVWAGGGADPAAPPPGEDECLDVDLAPVLLPPPARPRHVVAAQALDRKRRRGAGRAALDQPPPSGLP